MSIEENGDKAARIERIRAIVNEDYERIHGTSDPFVILNLDQDTGWEAASARYERYERFYRAENFQRLGDMDLTRKALDIRRAVGRAIVEAQGLIEEYSTPSEASEVTNTGILEVDASSAALGDIYYRDGQTYLQLGDLETAAECFRTACDYDPSRGVLLAYLAYTTFRRRMNEPDIIDETRRNLMQAQRMEPGSASVAVLMARYYIKLGDDDQAAKAIARVREIDPKHPKLGKLERQLEKQRA